MTLLVHWESARNRVGRPCRLDHKNRIIFNVKHTVPVQVFPNCIIVVAHIGVAMTKPRDLRIEIDDELMKIKKYIEVNMHAGPHHLLGFYDTSALNCVVCKHASRIPDMTAQGWPSARQFLHVLNVHGSVASSLCWSGRCHQRGQSPVGAQMSFHMPELHCRRILSQHSDH